MVRRVFYSFHYHPDNWRASMVRNIGSIEGNRNVTDNDWETIVHGGNVAIEKWINEQMDGRSCLVVLIGSNTTNRKWINYEINYAWNNHKGVVGVYIHNLKDKNEKQSPKGGNPFDHIMFTNNKKKLSSVVKAYDPPYTSSKEVYRNISDNLSLWVEEAIKIRDDFKQ